MLQFAGGEGVTLGPSLRQPFPVLGRGRLAQARMPRLDVTSCVRHRIFQADEFAQSHAL